MDYQQFITLVKEKLSKMNEKDKDNWIYAYARKVNSDYRTNFLESLDTSSKEVSYDIDKYLKIFEEIKDEEIYLQAYDEEYYDEVYHDWDYISHYSDVFKVLPKIEECIRICYEIILAKQYEKAYLLLSDLEKMEIFYINDEIGDCGHLCLDDLNYHDLIEIDIKEFYLACLYCAMKLDKSPEIIFNYYSHSKTDLHIDDILSYGPEEISSSFISSNIFKY